jgi:chaperonin GroEL
MAALHGARTLARMVGVTYGPRGGHVLLERSDALRPEVSRDGARVARRLRLDGPAENLVVQLIADHAERAALETGDGTTSTALLAAEAIVAGIKWTAAGHDAGALGRGLGRAALRMQEVLQESSREVRGAAELAEVARMGAGGDPRLGSLAGAALDAIGWEGAVTLESIADANATCSVETLEGFRLPVDRIVPQSLPATHAALRYVRIFVYDGSLELDSSMMEFLSLLARDPIPFVAIARDIAPPGASRLLAAAERGRLAPFVFARLDASDDSAAELFDDLALFTGARVRVGAALDGWPKDLADLGAARCVHVERTELRVVGGAGSVATIERRVEGLRARLEGADVEHRRALYPRRGRLVGRSAALRLAAATEPALRELESRAESALAVGRAALEEGLVPGGGIALLRAAARASHEQPENVGARLLVEATEALVARLVTNAGFEGRAVLEVLRAAEGAVGLNVDTGRIEDLEAAGVLDPLRVVRVALAQATAAAVTVLETGGFLTKLHPETPSTVR